MASSNIAARLGTAALLVPVMLGLIFWHQTVPMMLAVVAGSLVGLDEYVVMALGGLLPRERAADGALTHGRTVSGRATRLVALVGGASFAMANLFCRGTGDAQVALLVLTAVVIASLFVALVELGELAAAATRAAHVVFGIAYAVLPLGYLALIRRHDQGSAWVMIVLTVTWLGDTFAFAGGHLLGRRKLYPAVSPGKTVEGAVVGLLGSLTATTVAKLWYLPSLTWADCALIALPGNLLGQLGDLCESLIKRGAGVKDSGSILPGHGGVLDRIDALLFVSPYVYAYATWIYPL